MSEIESDRDHVKGLQWQGNTNLCLNSFSMNETMVSSLKQCMFSLLGLCGFFSFSKQKVQQVLSSLFKP